MTDVTSLRFQTYFPHVDNVYSHRSTQRHKRKRFISHYWDCRLKGRPPGTKKSTDPDKKKRKRVARERDLCDVKIKITEYFDQNEYEEQLGHRPPGVEQHGTNSAVSHASASVGTSTTQSQQFFGQSQGLSQRPGDTWGMPPNISQTVAMPQFTAGTGPSSTPNLKKFYTIQRVNGNGGNGKGDGVAGPHKHSLEHSDRVKKNSVMRWQAKCDKDDRRKTQVSFFSFTLLHNRSLHITFLPSWYHPDTLWTELQMHDRFVFRGPQESHSIFSYSGLAEKLRHYTLSLCWLFFNYLVSCSIHMLIP